MDQLAVAVTSRVWPTVREPEVGLRLRLLRVAAGAFTVRAAVALCPCAVAVRTAEPAETAVTRPAPFTVAMAGALVVQVTLAS